MEHLSGFQTAYSHRPDTVVVARSADDVRAAVAGSDAPVAVQATGHGLAVPADGGVLVDTGHLDGVHVDPDARTARVQAGTRACHVIAAAAAHGLAPRSGSFPGVGTVGYTLGGGLPVLGRSVGWAADHVRSIDVVTADGVLRTVDAGHEPELFAGLRGGGAGSFGVVTAMEIDLLPLTRIHGGALYVDTDHVADVLAAWIDATATATESVTSSLAVVPIPDVPGPPPFLRGRHVANLRVASTDAAAAEELVAPLRAVAPPLADTLGELAWTDAHTIFSEPDAPHAYLSTNALLRDTGPLTGLLDLVGPGSAVPSVLALHHLGGALSRPSAVPNAVGRRDARYLATVIADPAGASVLPEVEDTLAPAALGRFLSTVYGEQSTPEQVRTGFDDDTWALLLRLKAQYDPADRFRSGRPIPLTP